VRASKRFVTRACSVCEWTVSAVETGHEAHPGCPWCHAPAVVVGEESLFSAADIRAAAEANGRMGGLKGGPARAARLSPRRRREIARSAAAARWKGRRIR
jgi:hypothetical protein